MNKKILFLGMAAVALAGCSSDDLADSVNPGGNSSADETQVPVTFNTHRGNVTRAGSPKDLQDDGYNDFGVYAFKYNTSDDAQPIMGNFLVGFGGTNNGYSHAGSHTWAQEKGTSTDNKSPWFYEGLGSSEYSGTGDFIAKSLSSNSIQPLVFWDQAYKNTEFDAYAPYYAGAKFTSSSRTLTLPEDADKAKTVVAKATSTNSAHADVNLQFKHVDAEVRLAFYSDIANYRVKIVDLQGDGDTKATFATGTNDADKTGIVATPATNTEGTYAKGSYADGGTITVDYSGTNPVVKYTGTTSSQENLHFGLPNMTETEEITKIGASEKTSYKVVPVKASAQTYAYTDVLHVTPTQSGSTAPGFTFHVTFKLISEVTGEEITVYNAKVYVPSSAATWEVNSLNTYRFRITADALGSTDPGTEIDPSGVNPIDGDKALNPIVFDGATVEDYTETATDYDAQAQK